MPSSGDPILQHAADWAHGIWRENTARWSERTGQDITYREQVIHPALENLIDRFCPEDAMSLIEFGCGDGIVLDNEKIAKKVAGGRYLGVDSSEMLLDQAARRRPEENVSFLHADITGPDVAGTVRKAGNDWRCLLSVFVLQELPDPRPFFANAADVLKENGHAVLAFVHPDFARWLADNGRMKVADEFPVIDRPGPISRADVPFRWAGRYPIVDEPDEPFPLPYFHRTVDDYCMMAEEAGFAIEDLVELPRRGEQLGELVGRQVSPFVPFDTNLYWPAIAEMPSTLVIVARKAPRPARRQSVGHALHPTLTGGRSYEELKRHFMYIMLENAEPEDLHTYESPGLYNEDRVTYIIPPITDIGDRGRWRPDTVYVVKKGSVAIGRVFYTRTSGEYLLEELVLGEGDIVGEFEVPLTLFQNTGEPASILPPRFNMTYGAWASGPALNWAMSYPRHIPRDPVSRENAQLAVHPFYIKSKNIRPETHAEIIAVPVERFESIVTGNPELMSWFLMNVLRKNRLYFEPPSPGYGRSSFDIVARLIIRILAYRIRLGITVTDTVKGVTSCRTFLGPTEWMRHGLGQFMPDFKEVIQETGGSPRTTHRLPVFTGELADMVEAVYHYPVKDLDDDMLEAMGCSPAEDRADNRFGLLTGILIAVKDLDRFMRYLLEKGE